MFYYLASIYPEFLNLFRYVSFRTGAAMLTAFLFCLILGGPFIRLVKKRFQQPIRKEGPETHLKKSGTPTMGGILIIGAVFTASLLWCNLMNPYVWLTICVMASFGLIGFVDDYFKIARGNAYRGLSARTRLSIQFAIGIGVCYGIGCFMPAMLRDALTIPFLKNTVFDLGPAYVFFGALVIVAAANAFNLTDGVDSLASLTGTSAFMVFLVMAYLIGRSDYSLYLFLPHVPGAEEITVLIGGIIGGLLGFLWYNAHPAKIFMGDVGSLAVGGALGTVAVITKSELLLIIAGAIFVAEALSVIIQVGSFRFRKRRVFRMAPLHHHFELGGWSEQTVVIRFWIVSVILALLALSSIKVR